MRRSSLTLETTRYWPCNTVRLITIRRADVYDRRCRISDWWNGGSTSICVYAPLDGDGTITIRYVPQISSQHLQFGILMRETTDADSAQIVCLIQRGGRTQGGRWNTVLSARPATGADTSQIATQSLGAPTVTEGRLLQPCWLKLTRDVNTFTASFSTDGKQWSKIGSAVVPLGSQLLVGIGAPAPAWYLPTFRRQPP